MILRPKIANNIAMIFGGCIFSLIGFSVWMAIGGLAGLIPGILVLLGVLWICTGSLALAKRNKWNIIIDDAGIELPASRIFHKGAQRIKIEREDIATIEKHESVKGRLIQISKKSGDKIFIQARHYCELDDFISHCKNNGLPVVK